jgi:hypothetical protein
MSDSVSVEVVRAVNAIRLAVLITLLTLGATAGFSAGFAENSVFLGFAWGVGAVIVGIGLLAFVLRVSWLRNKTMAAMYWITGE